MKAYIAMDGHGWDTSRACVRRTLERCIHHGRRHRSNGRTEDEYEAYRLLGQAMHTLVRSPPLPLSARSHPSLPSCSLADPPPPRRTPPPLLLLLLLCPTCRRTSRPTQTSASSPVRPHPPSLIEHLSDAHPPLSLPRPVSRARTLNFFTPTFPFPHDPYRSHSHQARLHRRLPARRRPRPDQGAERQDGRPARDGHLWRIRLHPLAPRRGGRPPVGSLHLGPQQGGRQGPERPGQLGPRARRLAPADPRPRRRAGQPRHLGHPGRRRWRPLQHVAPAGGSSPFLPFLPPRPFALFEVAKRKT